MGHISNEPSMEEILSSIKRIIAEDGAKPRGSARQAEAEPMNHAPADEPEGGEPEVLELTDMVEAEEPTPPPAPHPEIVEPAQQPPAAEPARSAVFPPLEPSELVSTDAASASRQALASLSKLMVKPEPDGDGTLEGLVREMLRPMLKEWLDANLPDLVESMVAKEIARITGKAF